MVANQRHEASSPPYDIGDRATDRVPHCAPGRIDWPVDVCAGGYGGNSTVIEQLRAYPYGGVGQSRLRKRISSLFHVESVEQLPSGGPKSHFVKYPCARIEVFPCEINIK